MRPRAYRRVTCMVEAVALAYTCLRNVRVWH